MTETVKLWLENLYNEAIKEAKGTIENERLWEKGFNEKGEPNYHTMNLIYLEEYIQVLKELKEKLI